jgi:hypothetical protein
MRSENNDITIFSVKACPFGKTWSEWTAMWWQWILSIPKNQNPGNGHNVSLDQKDRNVFFLAGSFGGSVKRDVVVPAGKALFFPIINFTTSYAEDTHLKSEIDMIAEAKKDVDDIIEKQVTIDGMSLRDLEKYRIASQPFDINYPPDNVFQAQSGQTRGVSDGYWLFLYPLPPGKHKIHTLGACSSGRTRVDVIYNLTVK